MHNISQLHMLSLGHVIKTHLLPKLIEYRRSFELPQQLPSVAELGKQGLKLGPWKVRLPVIEYV